MNPVKELKKKRLSTIQRVLDFILKTSFFIVLFLLISTLTIQNLPKTLQQKQELLINFAYESALNQSEFKNLELNETQKQELQSNLKSEISKKTTNVLANLSNSIKTQKL